MKNNRLGRKYCGLCIKDTFHNMTGTKFWGVWQGIRYRTKDKTDKNYGGRGIVVCEEWEDFVNFYNDMHQGYSEGLTIERIDVNGPYSKENCTWVTPLEQQSNKRNNRVVEYQGEKMHLAELCRRSRFSKMMLIMRLNRGMTGDQAVEDARNSPYGKSEKSMSRKQMCMT